MSRRDYSMDDFHAEMRRRGLYNESGSLAASRTRRPGAVRKGKLAVARMTPVAPAENLWAFRATGRQALVVRVNIGRDVDTVVFRFVGDEPKHDRKVTTRRFLADFVRVEGPR